MVLRHYYHFFCNGSWHLPWTEQITALVDSGLYNELEYIKMGLVGSQEKRQEVKNLLKDYDKIIIAAESNGGFEQVTLDVLYKDVHSTEDEFYVLYGHTKGSAYLRPINNWWRRDMIRHTVYNWETAVGIIDEGYDAAGIFWRVSPSLKRTPVRHNHFSGNFWWATANYLRTLGPVQRNTRYDAEAWIGYNPNIRHFELLSGTPSIPRTLPTPKIIKRSFGAEKAITVYVNSNVVGPHGKLLPGTIVQLPDTPYTQVLLKSGIVVLWS